MNYYLAIDIGATSGRHIVGWRDGDEIATDEVYRFNNGVKYDGDRLVWDIASLLDHVKRGIDKALAKYPQITSLAVDTWGVDYVLMNGDDEIMPCYAYRDEHTRPSEVHKLVPFETLYARTGIQYQPFNTIYRLYEDMLCGRLDAASDFLMIPEYLSYKLTGVKAHEYTNATTTGIVNAATKEFDGEIIKQIKLPERLFCGLQAPGRRVGEYKGINVLLCASHDTASAVEGIPFETDSPYISSGTWSLLGVKTERAITDDNSRKANYSNEGGVGYIRYQKNIMGMWVVNRLRDELCPNKPWNEITQEASKSDFTEYVDVNDEIFLSPESMKTAFDHMLKTKPKSTADYFNCAYISLAHSYKQAIRELEHNTNKTYTRLYIVGGGAKNKYLNDLTAKICGIKVVALPIEATAIGNLKIQFEHAFIA